MAKKPAKVAPRQSAEKTASDQHLSRLPVYFMETSWRVALPILLLTIGGIKLDQHFGTNPAFSVIGVLLSLLFATLLVYRYLKRQFPETFKR